MIKAETKRGQLLFFPGLKMVSQGRAYELLRADVQEHLKEARKLGFEYCRFHAVFHDDMDEVCFFELHKRTEIQVHQTKNALLENQLHTGQSER